jgi:hypothetical protein
MKKIIIILSILVLMGITFLSSYIYTGLKYIPPHYHANFAVYINNERLDLSSEQYMEDISACSIWWEIAPKGRVHMHEGNMDTIHIHHSGVSWGHFFANIGIYFDDNRFLKSAWEEFWGQEKMHFILNGKEISNPYNRLIRSEDRLLIAYWEYSQDEINALYESVSQNAAEYNEKYDPGSCWGTNENAIMLLVQDFLNVWHDH